VKLRLEPTGKTQESMSGESSLGGRLATAPKTASKALREEHPAIINIQALEDA
jgi:hypothetical protein